MNKSQTQARAVPARTAQTVLRVTFTCETCDGKVNIESQPYRPMVLPGVILCTRCADYPAMVRGEIEEIAPRRVQPALIVPPFPQAGGN